MELRHIRYFVAVAEEQNFTRAAARLGMKQPPLSQQIKDLEAEVGVQLLRRVPHGAELTEAGRAFLDKARGALVATETATLAARRAARGQLGRLRVGFTPSAHFDPCIPATIRDFRRCFPDVDLQLDEANTARLLAQLTSGGLDVAFTHSTLERATDLQTMTVRADRLVAALPRNHACAALAKVPLTALAGDLFILKPQEVGPTLHKAVFEACRLAGFEPTLGQSAPQLATVITLVAAELGVSLVPSAMSQLVAAGVVYREIEGACPRTTLALAWRRHERAPVIRNFIASIEQTRGDIPELS